MGRMSRAGLPLPTRRLLTDQEAAAYCGVSVGSLKAHIRVSPVKIGNSVRYDVRALDQWLDGQNQSSPVTGDDWLRLLDESDGARA